MIPPHDPRELPKLRNAALVRPRQPRVQPLRLPPAHHLDDIAADAGDSFDLSAAQYDASALRQATDRLNARAQQPTTADEVQRLNACQMRISRLLIPVNYTVNGPFEQDPALGSPALPGLRRAATLPDLPEESNERLLAFTSLRRELNRLRYALTEARRSIETTLAATG